MSEINAGTACFMVKDDSLKTNEGDFWHYLREEGFRSWGKHGNYGCEWVYINVNSKEFAPGMPGIPITKCIVSTHPWEALSIDEFKEIWEILKRCKERGKYLLLTAKEYRTWFDTCEDWEWETISWRIYSDGSYRITVTHRPGNTFDFNSECGSKRKRLRRRSGMLSPERFDMLCDQLKVKGWGEPDRNDMVCDGSMWEIKHYNPGGLLIESSGGINFISGEGRPLDIIVECLPEPDESLFAVKK